MIYQQIQIYTITDPNQIPLYNSCLFIYPVWDFIVASCIGMPIAEYFFNKHIVDLGLTFILSNQF